MKNSGKLVIETEDTPIELDVLSCEFARDFTSFDFDAQKTIEGYSLIPDLENLSKNTYKDLKNVVNDINSLYPVTLCLDDQKISGKAKITENLSYGGMSLDLEIYL